MHINLSSSIKIPTLTKLHIIMKALIKIKKKYFLYSNKFVIFINSNKSCVNYKAIKT